MKRSLYGLILLPASILCLSASKDSSSTYAYNDIYQSSTRLDTSELLSLVATYPNDEINLLDITREQEAINLKNAHVRTRTRYLHYRAWRGDHIRGNYIWFDSFNTDGQRVLHRYLNGNGSLIHYTIYEYDDYGNLILERQFPKENSFLKDTIGVIEEHTYRYDRQGNKLEESMSYKSNYSNSKTRRVNQYNSDNLLISCAKTQENDSTSEHFEWSISYEGRKNPRIVDKFKNLQNMKEIHVTKHYDSKGFLIKKEKYNQDEGAPLMVDMTTFYARDNEGRLLKKSHHNESDELYAEYVYSYSGDTLFEHFSRKDFELNEYETYVRNQKTFGKQIIDYGTIIDIYEYNDKDLLVRETKEVKSKFSSPTRADTVVYEYYR